MTTIYGTPDEVNALRAALARNCECEPEDGRRCDLCQAVAYDQAWLNRMLFLRRIRRRLLDGEFK